MKRYIIGWILSKLFGGKSRKGSMLAVVILLAGVCLLGKMNFASHNLLDNITSSQIGRSARSLVTYGEKFEYIPGFPEKDMERGMSLQRKGYYVSYNRNTLQPNWVAWRLTAEHCGGNAKRDGKDFTEDKDVPSPRADTYDYIQSGYDRGHMCPAADNKWSHEAMEQSFLMTNICPQNPDLNRGDWNEIEQQCRVWAKKYGKIYIVCGPIFLKANHKRIGKHRVPVPDAFFKVVLRLTTEPRGIGFICRNTDGSHPKDFYVNSINDVERITGYTFYPDLDKETAREVKSKVSLKDWSFTPSRYHERRRL